ncbi:MAG: FimV/HubP family polar landmark protein [Methylobacter sp.]|uniref:FimV/HubP family polar landmark protein n=1 Tax=Methylobacter sp. TaxID=2051955 RepID=UPI002731FDD0|nr:FimV/HubP family polar landmark protein [Methylobacter sp.]MDP1665478.1 FimV/HubP family polar landmark protein [Methylobacter sp.]
MKKSKVRNLTKTLAVVSLLAPASGHTLGIGEIKLHSALNQNLDAEIALTLSGESVSDIKVNLAPPEKFDEAGVSWTYFLSKIKLETITHSNGTAVIKLTSKEALKEPFLDFLLEVSWPKGNLYREFTVLVDPPSVYNQATIPVSTSTERYAQPPVAMPQRQSHANGQSSEGEYGPTLGNDTLWSVAERARGQNDVSVEQMMIAIYDANPDAFYKGNVYALTAGKMLRIPEREAVLKLSRNQALAEFNRHKKAWKNHSAPAHDGVAKEKSVLSRAEGSGDNQLTLVAPTKAAVADHAVVTSVNEQASTEKKAVDASSVTSEIVKGKTERGASETVSADGGTQSKIAELEKQLAMMQELIALKDQQLAALQNKSKENPVVQEHVAPGQIVEAKPAGQVTLVPQSAEAASGEIVAPQPADQVMPVPQPPESVSGDVVTTKPVDQVPPVSQQAVAQPVQPVAQPEPEAGGLFDPYYLGAGGAGSVILALMGWFWWRKSKVDEETNTESMFASSGMINMPEADESLSVPVVEDGAIHDVGTVGESSFLSEFTPSDFDSFDTDQGEIDPISEADVYLAYGRYQQAEELIRQAIKDQPNRDECKLKLLEIFYANENKAAFEVYANELVEAGKQNEVEFWEKAAEMGREICPDLPLFSSGEDLFAVTDNASVENSNESIGGNGGFNKENLFAGTTSFGAAAGVGFAKETTAPKSEELDIDLILSEADSFVHEQRNNEDIDFDLSSFSMDTKESDKAEKDVVASSVFADKSSDAQIESIDFDLGSFSMDTKESDEAEKDFVASNVFLDMPSGTQLPNKQQEFEAYIFDSGSNNAEINEIESLDFSALENSNKKQQDVEFSTDKALDFNDDFGDDFDFNFDLDMPLTTSGQSTQYDEFGVSDLTNMDELETKLDLAKAYVDMGDADAAKDIAKEVLEQGTIEQKKAAQALLDELD